MPQTNAERWTRALFTRSTPINAQSAKITAARPRYALVEKATGVPWNVIGVIHYRESSLRLKAAYYDEAARKLLAIRAARQSRVVHEFLSAVREAYILAFSSD